MAFRVRCPSCDAEHSLAEQQRGKRVRCRSCDESFRADDVAGEADEAIQTTPRRSGSGSAPPRVPPARDSEAPRRRRSERDEDEEDGRRRERRRREREDSSSGLLIGMILGGVLLVAVIAGGLVFFLMRRPDAGAVAGAGGGGPGAGGEGAKEGLIQPAAQRVPLAVKDSDVRDIITNGPANTRAAVYFWEIAGKTKHIFDVYDLGKGTQLCRLELVEPQQMDLSPDGSRLAIFSQTVEAGQLARRVGVWSIPDGKALLQDWMPYPQEADFAKQRELVWAYLISNDQVLTVARQGQLDLWDIATRKRVYSVPPIATSLSLSTNGFGHTANHFAISPDRKTLAVFNKDGFSLFDTATGKLAGKTATLSGEGILLNFWGVGFSPDGKTLASSFGMHHKGDRAKHVEAVAHWSVADGQRLALTTRPHATGRSGGLAFWGPGHVLLWDGNLFEAQVWDLAKGDLQRTCKRAHGGKCVAQPQDGRLWVATGEFLLGPANLASIEIPNLARGPNDAPLWHLIPAGITAVPPR
jgi:hypothetical protein